MLEQLSQIPTFVWNSVKDHRERYGMGLVSIVVTEVIRQQWGKVAAVCFVVGVGANYPFFLGRIQTIFYIDLNSVMQALLAGSLPALYFYSPQAAPMYIPMLCTALAISILKKMWDDAGREKQFADIAERLREQNVEYNRLLEELRGAVAKLDVAMQACLGEPAKLEKVEEKQDALIVALDQLDQNAKDRLVNFKERIEALAAICENAKSQQSVIERMKLVANAETDLTKLTTECSKRSEEIRQLNQEFGGLKEQLRIVIKDLSDDEQKLKKRLIDLEKCLTQLEK